MKTLLPALLLALAACAAPPENRPIAGAVTGQTTPTDQANKLQDKNIAPNGQVADMPGVKAPAIDSTRRFEYAEFTIELGDPVGMRALVPYLIKPEIWTLVKCEMVSTTSKYYKFQKVTSNDGRSLPDVDVFKTGR